MVVSCSLESLAGRHRQTFLMSGNEHRKMPIRFGIRHLFLATLFAAFLVSSATHGFVGCVIAIALWPLYVLAFSELPDGTQTTPNGRITVVAYIVSLLAIALVLMSVYS